LRRLLDGRERIKLLQKICILLYLHSAIKTHCSDNPLQVIKNKGIYLKNAMSFPCFRNTGFSGADEDVEAGAEETDNL